MPLYDKNGNLKASGIADNSLVAAKLAMTATDKLVGRFTAGAGAGEEIDCTAAGRALIDDADATAQRVTLGVVIGTNVQAQDAELSAIAGLTSAVNKGIQFTGSGTAATYDLTAAGLALLDDATAAAQRTTLGLGAAALLADPVPLANGGTGTTTAALADDAIVLIRLVFAFNVTSALAAGSNTAGFMGSTNTNQKWTVPAGKTFKAITALGVATAGAAVDTYTFQVGVKKISTGIFTSCASNTGAENTQIRVYAEGTEASPLASYAAGDDIMAAMKNATAGNAFANTVHWAEIIGVLV